MEASRIARLAPSSSSSRISTPTKTLLPRSKHRRPRISDPIGPIKNSRGPDFTRSDTFVIVSRIKDCGSNDSVSEKEAISAKQTTRRISASFQGRGSLAGTPTVAKSALNAISTGVGSVGAQPRGTLRKGSSLTCGSKVTLTSSSTVNFIPGLEASLQDENAPPANVDATSPSAATAIKLKSRLPRSQTVGVLSDLKTSVSRPSLTTRSANPRSVMGFSRKTSASSTSTQMPQSSSRLRLPLPSFSSVTSLSRSSGSTTPEETGQEKKQTQQPQAHAQPKPQIHHISSAQPSAWWSGRFVALNDRYSNEHLAETVDRSPTSTPNKTARKRSLTPERQATPRSRGLPSSKTTSALRQLPFKQHAKPEAEEDARCLRIFLHLDSLCTTAEAHHSLFEWQQAYARRKNRPGLLPEGGCMVDRTAKKEDKGLMNRIFRNAGRKAERQSLSTSQSQFSIRGKPALANNGAVSRGKRLSVY